MSIILQVKDSCLIDPFVDYLRGAPTEWTARFTLPPPEPYQTASVRPRKRRKTESQNLSVADVENRLHHAEISDTLNLRIQSLQSAWKTQSDGTSWYRQAATSRIAFGEATLNCSFDFSKAPDSTSTRSRKFLSGHSHSIPRLVIALMEFKIGQSISISASQLCEALFQNESHEIQRLSVRSDDHSHQFMVPPLSAFLVRSMSTWQTALEQYGIAPPLTFSCTTHSCLCDEASTLVEGLDLVVIDPPWPNKSASRSSSYPSIDIYDLFQIDLHSILSKYPSAKQLKPCLVAVWVTNKPKVCDLMLWLRMSNSD